MARGGGIGFTQRRKVRYGEAAPAEGGIPGNEAEKHLAANKTCPERHFYRDLLILVLAIFLVGTAFDIGGTRRFDARSFAFPKISSHEQSSFSMICPNLPMVRLC